MRFDRRKTYPESNVASKVEVLKTIVPEKIGGVIKSRGRANVALNRAVGRIGHPFIHQLESQRMNEGGTSPFFGSQRINGHPGINLPDKAELITSINFPESGIAAEVVFLNSTGELVPEGLLVTATAVGNFGIDIIYPVPLTARITGVVKKVKGTFVNWEGRFDGFVSHLKPGTAKVNGWQSVLSIEPNSDEPLITYQIQGVTNVTAGDQFLVSWLGLVTKVKS